MLPRRVVRGPTWPPARRCSWLQGMTLSTGIMGWERGTRWVFPGACSNGTSGLCMSACANSGSFQLSHVKQELHDAEENKLQGGIRSSLPPAPTATQYDPQTKDQVPLLLVLSIQGPETKISLSGERHFPTTFPAVIRGEGVAGGRGWGTFKRPYFLYSSFTSERGGRG